MYRSLLLGVASSAALVSSAFAADIYSPAAPVYAAVALPPSWGGFYAGINGGFGGNSGLPFREDVLFPNPILPQVNPYSVILGSDTIAGGFGGGQLGYNFQFGSFVLGAEADVQGSGIRGSGANAIFNPANLAAATTPIEPVCQAFDGNRAGTPLGVCAGRNTLDVDWFGTVRGRVGWAFGNTLLYGTGGFAAGGVKTTFSYEDNNAGAVNHILTGRTSKSATQTGWSAGAGIETKIAPNWSLKGEYQFIDLGSVSAGPTTLVQSAATPPIPALTELTGSKDVNFHTVRVGINYYFNAPPAPLPLK